jgi:hypothetical protein
MLRRVIRLHTLIVGAASLALLLAPVPILQGLGITAPSFPELALTRIGAGLLAVLAVAVLPLPELPAGVRGNALRTLAAAYGVLAALAIGQQIAIWSSTLGVLLSAELVLHALVFAALAHRERAPRAAGA